MSLWAAFLAAVLAGQVLGPGGSAVSGARVSVRTATQTDVAATETDAEGRFSLPNLPAGSYQLRVERSGFAEWQSAVEVAGAGAVERQIRLTVSPVRSEVTVTAEPGSVVELDSVPQRMTVIGRGVLAERAATTLTEAFNGESGVAEQRTSPGMGGFFVRGMTGKNVAVYRDGVRYSTSAQRGGVSTFANLTDAAHLESVEVLRGPGSAQFGSDAMGGAVSLISRAATFTERRSVRGEVSTNYQSANHAVGSQAQAAVTGSRMAGLFSLSGRRASTVRTGQGLDSHNAVTRFLGLPSSILGERLTDTAFTQYGGSAHVQMQLSPVRHLTGHYERGQQDAGKRYDQLIGGDGNLVADLRNLMLDFGYLRYQHFNAGPVDQWSLTGSYNAQREERVNQGGQGNPLGRITHQYERLRSWGLQTQAEKRAGSHAISFGADSYWEKMRSPAFTTNPVSGTATLTRPRVPDGANYVNYGLYVQDAWRTPLEWLRVNGALRFGGAAYESRASDSPLVNGQPLWPDDSLSASAFSGRVGAVAQPAEWFLLSTQYSHGFRAPSMTDLGTLGLQGNGFYEASYAAVSGLNGTVGDSASESARPTGVRVAPLRPESSDSIEAAAVLRSSRVRAEVTGFRMKLRDTIVSQTLLLPQGAVGIMLGDQVVTRQLPNGAVFVPASPNAVLVRANLGGAVVNGVEQTFRVKLSPSFSATQNLTWVEASDSRTGLPPDIEPGIPPPNLNATLLYAPAARRVWVEAYVSASDRQSRLSSLALEDRRIGASRTPATIAAFFNNGARVRGLVRDGRLLATGETLAQVQNRVLPGGTAAPLFTAIPGYALFGLRGGFPLGSRTEVMVDLANLADRNYRGIGWGVDGLGRSLNLRLKTQF